MSVENLTNTFRLIRSKDAGPFMLTIDLFCHDADAYRRVLDSGVVQPQLFADLYGVDPSDVEIHRVETLNAVKVSFPTSTSKCSDCTSRSGSRPACRR